MRLPPEKVKDALEHPEQAVRDLALAYFAESYSPDPDVMPRVIRAVARHGRTGAFDRLELLRDLAQTGESVDWLLRELSRPEGSDPQPDDEVADYDMDLSWALADADVRLLEAREAAIQGAPRLDDEARGHLDERLRLATLSAAECWAELETLAADAAAAHAAEEETLAARDEDGGEADEDFPDEDDEDGTVFDADQAERVAEALARFPDQADRALDRLSPHLPDFGGVAIEPAAYLDASLMSLAGRLRLEAAVPRLVNRMLFEEMEFLDDYTDSLVRIGTDGVVAALAEAWPDGGDDYRLTAAEVLERIPSDASLQAGLKLLAGEEDPTVRAMLAAAVLRPLSPEAVEPVRQIVASGKYDQSFLHLKGQLVTAATLMGVTFPEYKEWKAEAEAEAASWDEALQDDLPQMSYDIDEDYEREDGYEDGGRPAPFVREGAKVGRNDPCPCGSGKKYKKCCLPKERE